MTFPSVRLLGTVASSSVLCQYNQTNCGNLKLTSVFVDIRMIIKVLLI